VTIALLVANVLLLGAGAMFRERKPPPAGKGIRVGLVFDVGGKSDRSFNEAAWQGLQRVRDQLGGRIEYFEPSEGADRESGLRQMAAKGLDLVIGVGFVFSSDLDRVARQFPGVRFAGIDYYGPSDGQPPNLEGIRFREEEGSFLVGAIAGELSRSHVVGFVGGMKVPLIEKFEAGYAAGVRHVCPACRILPVYAGTEPKAFSDPTLGQELALAQYRAGADIVFHAAGKTGQGVFAAARNLGKRAIGVDSDQSADAPCCVVTSMIKRVDVAVFEVAREVAENRFHGGTRVLGLVDDAVGFVSDERNRHLLPVDVAQDARRFATDIVSGRVRVPEQ
jgi:basic membrane protein A